MRTTALPPNLLCHFAPARRLLVCLALVPALAGGCARRRPPIPDIDAQLPSAAGVADGAIVFRTEGDPTDADGPADPGTLTPDEAVRLTLVNNPQVQAAIARLRSALADARQSRLLPNPMLSVVYRFPEGG